MNKNNIDLITNLISNTYNVPVKNEKKSELKNSYSLMELIREYENGYEGNFSIKDTDMRLTYDKDSGTILVLTESGKYPASLSSRFLSATFVKEKLLLNNIKAFELINSGNKVYFEAAINNTKYSGWIKLQKNYPEYSFNQRVGNFSDEWLLLNALFNGKWNI